MQAISLVLSVSALFVSGLTAWLTLLRKGEVKMTRPATIYFGPDGGPDGSTSPKVYLRTLLFCTSKRGRVLESMYVTLRRNESRQNFSIWVLGDEKLSRGSGLFVSEQGVVANHHFLLPRDQNTFQFVEGMYSVEVYGVLLGGNRASLLFEQTLSLSSESAKHIKTGAEGCYFDWGPDSQSYVIHISDRPTKAFHDAVLASLRAGSE